MRTILTAAVAASALTAILAIDRVVPPRRVTVDMGPTRFAVVAIGRATDWAATAMLDGTRLRVSTNAVGFNAAVLDMVAGVVQRFPDVQKIEGDWPRLPPTTARLQVGQRAAGKRQLHAG
jgi:hypothetical protein